MLGRPLRTCHGHSPRRGSPSLTHHGSGDAAFGEAYPLSASEKFRFGAGYPRPTRSCTCASPPALPRPSQGSLPTCGASLWSDGFRTHPTTNRVSRTIASPFLSDQPSLVAHAPELAASPRPERLVSLQLSFAVVDPFERELGHLDPDGPRTLSSAARPASTQGSRYIQVRRPCVALTRASRCLSARRVLRTSRRGGWVASGGALCVGMFFSRTVAPTLEGGLRDWVPAAGQRRKGGARRQVVPGG